MKPPRSVWVVVSPHGRPQKVYPPIERFNAENATWPGGAAVRYVLPPKPKALKGERGEQVKPPRGVWVCGRFVMCEEVDGWTRYDLHRPKKRKARKGERRSR